MHCLKRSSNQNFLKKQLIKPNPKLFSQSPKRISSLKLSKGLLSLNQFKSAPIIASIPAPQMTQSHLLTKKLTSLPTPSFTPSFSRSISSFIQRPIQPTSSFIQSSIRSTCSSIQTSVQSLSSIRVHSPFSQSSSTWLISSFKSNPGISTASFSSLPSTNTLLPSADNSVLFSQFCRTLCSNAAPDAGLKRQKELRHLTYDGNFSKLQDWYENLGHKDPNVITKFMESICKELKKENQAQGWLIELWKKEEASLKAKLPRNPGLSPLIKLPLYDAIGDYEAIWSLYDGEKVEQKLHRQTYDTLNILTRAAAKLGKDRSLSTLLNLIHVRGKMESSETMKVIIEAYCERDKTQAAIVYLRSLDQNKEVGISRTAPSFLTYEVLLEKLDKPGDKSYVLLHALARERVPRTGPMIKVMETLLEEGIFEPNEKIFRRVKELFPLKALKLVPVMMRTFAREHTPESRTKLIEVGEAVLAGEFGHFLPYPLKVQFLLLIGYRTSEFSSKFQSTWHLIKSQLPPDSPLWRTTEGKEVLRLLVIRGFTEDALHVVKNAPSLTRFMLNAVARGLFNTRQGELLERLYDQYKDHPLFHVGEYKYGQNVFFNVLLNHHQVEKNEAKLLAVFDDFSKYLITKDDKTYFHLVRHYTTTDQLKKAEETIQAAAQEGIRSKGIYAFYLTKLLNEGKKEEAQAFSSSIPSEYQPKLLSLV